MSVRPKGTTAIGRFNLIPRPGLDPTVRIDICESAVLEPFCYLSILQFAEQELVQLLFREVQNAFMAKLVKHCALTKINSVTVGTE